MSKPEIVHLDKLGNRVKLNDVVAVAHHNSIIIGRVIKLNPKMVKVKEFTDAKVWKWGTEFNKYSDDMVRIQESDAVMYILKYT